MTACTVPQAMNNNSFRLFEAQDGNEDKDQITLSLIKSSSISVSV